ncbi:peptidoglycan recognition protein family protein [Vallitalea okinawensis]|uniref:peptidoglycan recognition protein family protein n=1 Tax=Vallitalea okinawensis TaxID=2078660 RepID=UPI000CFCB734|nr:N-acetylmuramoyl-L-alanine amidase [Vallitalea okinawensis]
MIEKVVIQNDEIYGVPFRADLIPISNKTSRPQYPMNPTSITVHNTGNSNKGADAEVHTEYVDDTTSYVSWHFTVDDKQIIQELPINESAWHAGDGTYGKGNRSSIGIEICEQEGIDWARARSNAVKLIVWLFNNVESIQNVVPHKEWTGKYCPHKILDEGWELFVDDIKKYFGSVNRGDDVKMSWQQKIGIEAIRSLGEKDLIKDVDGWCEKDLMEPTPLWLFFEMINRVTTREG